MAKDRSVAALSLRESGSGFWDRTLKLDGFRPDFADALATASGVVVMVKIADWRPPGSAWGQQIIYVVYTVPGDRG